MKKDKKYADLFGNNQSISLAERNRVCLELQKMGSLTFKVEKHKEGWLATCVEIDGIIAGNTNNNHSQSEIESEIREAVYAAFNIKFEEAYNPIKIEYKFILLNYVK